MDIINLQEQDIELTKNPASRFAYFEVQELLHLYADGECFPCQANRIDLVQHLCDWRWSQPLLASDFSLWQENPELLVALINQGSILLPDDH